MFKLRSPYLLLLFSLLILLPGLFNLPIIDRDEPHFAQATRQMLQTGHYFQIRFQDQTRFQKPPGINWLQALGVRSFSSADAHLIWPYRLPSLLGALLSVLFTYLLSRRLLTERTALLGSFFLASTFLLVMEAHLALIDATLLLSVVLMQGALWHIYTAELKHQLAPRAWALLFWMAMCFGFLLKGVTPLVAILSIGSLCILLRRIDWLRSLRPVAGVLLFIALNVLWLYFVNQAEHSNYLLEMFKKDLLPKLAGGHESHGKPPLFHLLILPLMFWPVSLFLWQGAMFAWQHRSDRQVQFLLSWLLPTWVFFEIMPTKLPHYVLPTFPALALLCAWALTNTPANTRPSKTLHGIQLAWWGLSIGFASVFPFVAEFVLHEAIGIAWIIFISISLFASLSLFFAWKGKQQQAAYACLLTAVFSFPLIFSGFLPQLNSLWISQRIAQVIEQLPRAQQPTDQTPLLVTGDYQEPSLVFFLNTNRVLFTQDLNQACEQMKSPHPSLLLVSRRMAQQQSPNLPCATPVTTLGTFTGYNYSKGEWVRLLLLAPQVESSQ